MTFETGKCARYLATETVWKVKGVYQGSPQSISLEGVSGLFSSEAFEPYAPRVGDEVKFRDWPRAWICKTSLLGEACLITDGHISTWCDTPLILPVVGAARILNAEQAPPAPDEDREAAFWAKNREYWKTQDNPPLEAKPEPVIDPVAGWTRGDALGFLCERGYIVEFARTMITGDLLRDCRRALTGKPQP